MIHRISLVVLLFTISIVCTNCNNDDSTPQQSGDGEEITSFGGTIESPDKNISVTIPAGAVNTTVSIEVKEQTNVESNGIGKIYSLTNQEFIKPVTLTLKYSDEELTSKNTHPILLQLVTRESSSAAWELVKDFTLDTQAKTIQANVTHFSDWTLVSVDGTLDYIEGNVSHKNLLLAVSVNNTLGYPATFDAISKDRHFAMKVDSTIIGTAYETRSAYLNRIVALGTTPQDTTLLFIEPANTSNCYQHADGQTRFQFTQYSTTLGNLVQGTFKVVGTVPANANACQNITGSFAYIVK